MRRVRGVCLYLVVVVLALWSLGLGGCQQDQPKTIRLEHREPLPAPRPISEKGRLNLSVGAILTPEQGYVYYQELIAYLADQLSLEITVVDPINYQKLNDMLQAGDVDVAFVCSGPYVEGRERFGLWLLAAPVVNGEPAYYSNLIVPAQSPVRSLADLRGKTFAFTDPHSNTGTLVPRTKLADMGTTPEAFFASFTYTYAHDRSIHAVAERLVDGAAVDSLIWDYMVAGEPDLRERVRVVERYGPFGIPPVVAGPHVAAETREKIRQVLLTLHENPRGKEILQKMHIERFVDIDDSAYDSIRRMHALDSKGTP
ncbi:substrate-binding domain-containing protein [Geoalkalibacter sp.]|uniref:substrate-binding domain-containing protein n=1 Tax=Geoalkalibacter sp. TaxID=3041440 RepID=UPI00272E4BE5|nr:phosphate/phosphite/phosphonate ABC transporter substrate-binding protein [Geoalkalibacter sp.]